MTQARLLFLAAVLAAAGCRTTSPPPVLVPLPALPGAEEAVALAEASKDPAMAADLLWVHANRRAEARARLEAGLRATPLKAPLLLRRAVLDLVELRPDAAVDALTQIIAHAPESPEAEVALLLLYERLEDLRYRQADIEAAVVKADLLGSGPAATAGRVTLASALLARIARHQVDLDLEQSHLARGGWLTQWRAIGPLAPMDRGAFLADSRYAQSGDWSMLPSFRGAPVRPRVVYAEGHRVASALGNAPGLYVFDAYFEVSEEAATEPLMLEAHLPASARVSVDGGLVTARDAADRRAARRTQVPLRLGPGWHRVAVTLLSGSRDTFALAITTRLGQPVVRASKSGPLVGTPVTRPPAVGSDAMSAEGDASALGLVRQLTQAPNHAAFGRLLGAALALDPWVDDPDLAWGFLHGAVAALPDSAALGLVWAAWLERADLAATARAKTQDVLHADPTLPSALLRMARATREEQPERALALVEAARVVAPEAWRTEAEAMDVYRRLAYQPEAVAALAAAVARRAPARVLRAGVRLLRGLRRDAQADALEAELIRQSPRDAPRLRAERAAEVGALEDAVNAYTEAAALGDAADNLARAAELYLGALRPRDAARAARAALDREPAHAGAWRIALQAALLTGDLDGAGDALAQLRLHSDATLELEAMASEAGVGGAAEVELLLGQCPKGVDTPLADLLCGKLAFDPWPWVRPAQPGDLPPGQDPADRWASHQSVLLLDRVVDRVLPDGRAMTSFHAVSRLQTKEAADRAGELELPTDALALALVTLKPDGRRLEVDRHAGKDDLSFSALAPGDAVERRWVRIEGPATPWGGYIRKFYFASGDPMVRSELAVVVKKGTRVLHLERNGAPAPQIMEAGDEVLYLWQAEQVPAVPPEPHTPGADEFLPHVVVSVGVSPQHALATQQLGTDEAARGSRQVADQALVLTATIAEPQAERAAGRSPAERGGTAPPARDPMEARAERLFQFVVESIDDGPPRPPELVLDTRRGERSGLFVALLRAAEIPADVVWARAGMAPPLDPAAPDPQAFGIRLVRLEPRPGQVRWASLEGKRWWYGAPPPYLVGGAYLRRTGPRLEVLPLLDEGADGWAVASRAELTVAQDGHAQGRLEITLPAGYASGLRAFLRSARAEDKARQLQGLVAALLRGGRLLRSQATPLDAPLEPLTLTLEVEVPHFMVPDGDHLVAEELFEHPPGLRTLGLPLLEAYLVAPRRETPLLVRPASEHLQVTLHLPAGARADVQPGTFERKLPFGHFAQRFELDPATGTARLDLQYTLRMVRIPPDGAGNPGFSEFARAAQEVIQATRNRLVLQRGP